uniref:BZIP domain-containing protein n=1 Tax=Parastrongyloides trichosuri TaxID=131310 RepID=A0A0N4ZAC5_PARTI
MAESDSNNSIQRGLAGKITKKQKKKINDKNYMEILKAINNKKMAKCNEELRNNVKELRSENKELMDKIKQLEDNLIMSQKKNEDLNVSNIFLTNTVNLLMNQNNMYVQTNTGMQNQVNELTKTIEDFTKKYDRLQKEYIESQRKSSQNKPPQRKGYIIFSRKREINQRSNTMSNFVIQH